MGNMDEWHWAVSTEQMLYDASIHNYFLGIFRGRLPFPKWLILRSSVLWPRRFDTFFFSSRLNFKVKIFWPINCPISESTSDFFYVGRHFWFIMRRIGWNICSAKRLNQQCLRRWWIMKYYAASYSSSRRKKKLWFRRREKSVSNNRNVSNVIDKVRTLHTYMIGTRHASLFERIRYANLLSLVFIHSSQKWLSALTDSKRHYSFSILQEKKMLKINSKCSVHVQ